jgi:hypothetical protein
MVGTAVRWGGAARVEPDRAVDRPWSCGDQYAKLVNSITCRRQLLRSVIIIFVVLYVAPVFYL